MSQTEDGWTGRWVAKAINGEPTVSSVDVLSPALLRVERSASNAVIVATTAAAPLDSERLLAILSSDPQPDFVVTLSKESTIDSDAFKLSSSRGIPIGTLGDLKRALQLEDLSTYRDPEFAFVERCLTQHTRVERFERLDERRYRIYRIAMKPVTAVFINDYDVTADSMRNAREKYGEFSLVAVTNPNARVTDAASEVAKALDSPILMWGQFLSALNKP